ARKQGLKANMFGGDGLFSPEFIKLGGDAVEGSMSALGFSPEQAISLGPKSSPFFLFSVPSVLALVNGV
ncbi:MAG: hypothetical protein ABI478_14555, partial [Propionivibrio sp.]